ncbi:MAG TPA: hypothetical protein VG937_29780 [Polyangiaceae bacterium]|nr:hypothetical protein [Polyangiaceae bacterium]
MDWRSPLVERLLASDEYQDGTKALSESLKLRSIAPTATTMTLRWHGLRDDFGQCHNTYQAPVITEMATLALACILTKKRAATEITEVTRRGEKVDYWLGQREFVLEVSGTVDGDLDALTTKKSEQLRDNPFERPGYVCVARYATCEARLWFVEVAS